jgi:hypothetical protein
MNHGFPLIDLGPKAVNEHIHYIRLRVEAVIKNMFEDHGLCDRAIGMAHQILKQRELPWLKFDAPAAAAHLA